MPFDTSNKLVIAVSSRALFNLDTENKIFEQNGEEAYMNHQWENQHIPLKKGVAYPFIKRILQFNGDKVEDNPVEVIVLSKNDPFSGLRFFKSCEHYGLNITRGVFTAGKDPYPYMDAFDCCLFLSANREDVDNAMRDGKPAGLILPTDAPDDPRTGELRIAFDFDGVLADDSSELIFQNHGIEDFHKQEKEKALIPAPPGPLKVLIERLAKIQKLEKLIHRNDPSFKSRLRISIVTARNAPAHERVITTLKKWGIIAVEAFFLGGLEKRKVLEILNPHIFFDDQLTHLETAKSVVPSVHIPFGIANERKANREDLTKE